MSDNGSRCKVSVDGTDFRIQEPSPFNRKWFSKKFKGPGVHYKVGICIKSDEIAWINGHFPWGEWGDLKTALSDLVCMFVGDERAIADSGYRGNPLCFAVPWRELELTMLNSTQKGLGLC